MVAQSYDRMTRIRKTADRLFGESYASGVIWRIYCRVMGKKNDLKFLGNHNANAYTPVRMERQSVDIDRIIGTSGSGNRFDAHFHPTQPGSKARWASVASGMMEDIMRMPPVELVQINNEYYVLDGHHRVSTARALGKIFVDANVTRWEATT